MNQLRVMTQSLARDTRAVTSTLGYIFIVSMVVLSAAAIVGVGAVTISDSQDTANEEGIDQAMTQLDSQMSLVAFEGGSQQEVDLSASSDEQLTIQETGEIKLELRELENGELETIDVIKDESLYSLVYEGEHRDVAYQGGGVWAIEHDDPDSAEMVSPPEFSYDEHTATMPFVTVQEDDDFVSSDGQLTLSREDDPEPLFPQQGEENLTNPVDPDYDLVLTIQNDYYQAWGKYFEDRLDSDPIYHHDENKVEIILVSEDEGTEVTSPVTSMAGDNRIDIQGQGTEVMIDSYDSTEGDYSDSQTTNGSIYAKNGISMHNGIIEGDVVTEGDIQLSGNARVTGDAYSEGGVQSRGSSGVDGDVVTEAEVDSTRVIDMIIEQIRSEFETDNDNTQIAEIDGDRSLDASDDPTIGEGDYYLSNFNVEDGESVTFDVSDGDVRIVVDDAINVDQGEIEVINNHPGNDNRVQIFTRSNSITLGDDITTEGDEAGALWFYGPSGTDTTVQQHSDVTGVIYTPGTDESPGQMTVESHANVYGAALGGDTELENQASVHYDQALMTEQPFKEQRHVTHISTVISYFHISETEIHVSD